MLVGLVLIHKLIEATPRNLLQYAVEYTIVVLHGLILLRVPKRRQTLGTQKNQCHAPCPPKLNRTAVGLSRASTSSFHAAKTWMAGTSSAKTRFALLPGHDVRDRATTNSCPSSPSPSDTPPATARRHSVPSSFAASRRDGSRAIRP